MLAVRLVKLKILKSVVLLLFVPVMDNLAWKKSPPKMALHYKSVLKHMVREEFSSVGMIFTVNQHVSVLVNHAATFPVCRLWTFPPLSKRSFHSRFPQKLSDMTPIGSNQLGDLPERFSLTLHFQDQRLIAMHSGKFSHTEIIGSNKLRCKA